MKKILLAAILILSSSYSQAGSTKLKIDQQERTSATTSSAAQTEDNPQAQGTEQDSTSKHKAYVPIIREKDSRIPCNFCLRL